MNRSVLVTGAGGFVGSHLAQGLVALGYRVVALDQIFDAPTRQRLQGCELVQTPLTAAALADREPVNLLVHGAAITTPPAELGLSEAAHMQANVALLDVSLDWARRSGVEQFVLLSSSGVFNPEDGTGIQLESDVPHSTAPYARAKRAGEDAVLALGSGRLQALAVRLGPIYGPHEAPRSTRTVVSQVRRWLDRAEAGEPIMVGLPEERRDWTFAPDLPKALHQLLQMEPRIEGVVHLCSGQIVSNLELAQAIAGVVEGARIVVERNAGVTPRLPMGSDRLDLGQLHAWTQLTQGLMLSRQMEGMH